MNYIAVADTDIGISKQTNQDSLLIKQGTYEGKNILLTVVCDGMGGLAKGEVASATVIRGFSKWFEEELPYELDNLDMQIMARKWSLLLRELNARILEYGKGLRLNLGTTFTGCLFVDNEYMVVHVGDTRFYRIDRGLYQLTEDHTFIAREIKRGTMTPEQAKTDKRRNMLLQCIGASEKFTPQVLYGQVEKGAYLICSDGFRHEISEREIYESLNPVNLVNKELMQSNIRYLIDLVKRRNEKDNISAILIKAE